MQIYLLFNTKFLYLCWMSYDVSTVIIIYSYYHIDIQNNNKWVQIVQEFNKTCINCTNIKESFKIIIWKVCPSSKQESSIRFKGINSKTPPLRITALRKSAIKFMKWFIIFLFIILLQTIKSVKLSVNGGPCFTARYQNKTALNTDTQTFRC